MNGFIICSFLLLNLLNSGSPLKCPTCYSQKSWADCNRCSKVLNCPPFLDTCMTVHRKKTLHNGQIMHEFAKSCFMKKLCTRTYCQQNTFNETRHVTCGVLKCSKKLGFHAVKLNKLNEKFKKLKNQMTKEQSQL